jgi:hypothetical protein
LSFASHLLTDAQFSGWKQYWFWPVSHEGYLFPGAVQLEHPINYWFVYLSFLVVGLIAVAFKRTPIDIFSPKLNQMVVAFFQKKDRSCATCGRACNQRCDGCAQAVCLRHGSVRRGMRLLCPACMGRGREGN